MSFVKIPVMKELQRTFFYLSVVLETVSEMLCLGSEFVMIHRQDRIRSAVFHKVKEGMRSRTV